MDGVLDTLMHHFGFAVHRSAQLHINIIDRSENMHLCLLRFVCEVTGRKTDADTGSLEQHRHFNII